MNVKLTDKYELRQFDKLSMQLWELRDVETLDKPIKEGGKPTGKRETKWVPCGNYFADVPSAVDFVYKRIQREDPYAGELAGAIDRMESIAAQLRAAVASA